MALVVVGLLAVAFTVLPASWLVRQWWLRHTGVRTRAAVVGLEENHSKKGTARSPIVEFTAADGRTIRTHSPIYSGEPTALPGRVMTVYYNPKRPDEVAIVGYGRGVSWGFLLIGILLFGLLALLMFGSGDQRTPAISNAIPVVLGCALFGVGGIGIGRTWLLRVTGGHVDGVVVGEHAIADDGDETLADGDRTLHYPVVRFRLPDGQEIDASPERGHHRRRVRQGDHVRVHYHRKDPYRIVLARYGTPPLFWFFAFFGLVLLTWFFAFASGG